MKLDAMLCNHAETANNLLYVSGGGVNTTHVPAAAPGPYAVNLGFGMIVTVPWEEIGKAHEVHIELVDGNGNPVALARDAAEPKPLEIVISFSIDAGAPETEGDDQTVALAANLGGVPLPDPGKYEFVLSIGGQELRRLGFRVAA
jgi:hypothetical protein